MAFNSNSYHRNKARRRALEYLEQARQSKRQIAAGEGHAWETPVERLVWYARNEWRLYLSYLKGDRMNADLRTMRPTDFIAKYGGK